MYYVYVLKSKRTNKHYVGFTGKGVQKSLAVHNSGSNRFAKQNRPFELIYWEEYQDRTFVQKRERFLKSGHGRSALKRKLAKG